MELDVNPDRLTLDEFRPTGIWVRAKLNGKWDTYDISQLTRESLFRWLRSRGGSNPWAENTVAILFGYEPEPFWHQQ